MAAALLIDFGSTYTKLRAVDIDAARILATGQGPSTVDTDVTRGMDAALADLEHKLGTLPRFAHRLASSSAAGGLRMVTIGLVPELTAEAARQAALGAGARLVGTFAYRLTERDAARIAALAPDIVLLAGGTNGGNSDVILHNAKRLATLRLGCPVVVAGNRETTDDILRLLDDVGQPVRATENVMPEFGVLDVDPAREAIRQVFIERIVHAKGIDRAATRFDAVLMPTPAAVLKGAQRLADGAGSEAGIGELMVIDVGGATTDVHSIATGAPTRDGVVQYGLPEPRAKRTVEGDLGMRHNAAAIVEAAGLDAVATTAQLTQEVAGRLVELVSRDVERVPRDADERALDQALGRTAVRIAVARHAGSTKVVQTVHGPVTVQTGKDLTSLPTVIGTGGPLAHGLAPARILEAALAHDDEPQSLRPRSPALLIDADYILYASGLLASVAPEAAVRLAKASLQPVGGYHERRQQSA